MTAPSDHPAPWWQAAAIYQIYPRSFRDSDGDGVGDLRGIASRLDYLGSLGVGAVWLSPIFPSPMADFGYDVADYCGVDPMFGTLADLDALVAAAHARGLRVLLDLVPNHSSSEHPWFKASRSSREDPKRDWYIWRDAAADGGPPNNWTSDFGGSAWEWDDETGQYYLHAFLKEQPDLNWRNLELRAAMMDVLRFWFARGIDGFRIDVLWHMVKHADFPDNPANPDWSPGVRGRDRVLQLHSTDQPEVHAIAAEMRAVADEFGRDGRERLLIGEIYLPYDRLMTYYGTAAQPEVHLPFNFRLIGADWTATSVAAIVAEYEAALPDGAWPNWVLGNHDQPRIAGRIGEAQARVAQMLLLTLRGTPTLYYGDELGLAGGTVAADRIRDPQALREPGAVFNRDEARMPMPWTGEAGAGFTTGEAWLPIPAEAASRNVAAAAADPASMLSLVRHLLSLRADRPALTLGGFALLGCDGDVLVYERRLDDERLLVALNLSDGERGFALPDWAGDLRPIASTTPDRLPPGRLGPDQGIVLG